MFKFNFEEDESVESAENETDQELNASLQSSKPWIEAKEMFFKDATNCNQYVVNNCNASLTNTTVGNTTIKYLAPNDIINLISKTDSLILKTERDHSDLITAIYEGGFKLWNGTFDVLEYLNRENISFENMNVLDLGCGNGLIGLFALLHGAANVTFQDYNEEVLKYITIPNTQINNISNVQEKCRFFSGDWSSFAPKLPANYFDFILTADTIYNTDNYDKLHLVFESLLKRTGRIFLAAKSVYFGLSGEIRKFNDLLKERDVFESRNVFSIMDGIQREILEVKFK